MRDLVVITLVTFICGLCYSQPSGYGKVTDLENFKKNLEAKTISVQSFTSEFVQEKNLKALKEKLRSTGQFSFAHPDKVRMEYKTPFEYLMVINNDRISIRDGQKVTNYNSSTNKMFAAINQLMMDIMQGKLFDNKSFQTSVFESSKQYLCIMKPLKSELKSNFSEIHVYLSKDDLLMRSMEMKEHGGDYTVLTLLEKKINAQIPASAFSNF